MAPDYASIRVTLKTPAAIGKSGHAPVLDSLLLHRLMLIEPDLKWAMAAMPLARIERAGTGVFACGGGINPSPSSRYEVKPVYRKLMSDRRLLELANPGAPAVAAKEISSLCGGQLMVSTSSSYSTMWATRLDFRFVGDVDQIMRLMVLDLCLGPGQSVGMGEIERVDVLDAPTDADDAWLLTDPRGRLSRPIPMALGPIIDTKQAWPGMVRVLPPYWMGASVPGYSPIHAAY